MDDVKQACDYVADAAVAGCQAIQKAWDNLDPGLKQWLVMGLSIAASMALPGIGGMLVSCVIDGTFVDMLKAVSTGDWAMLALSCAAFVPGGKALKGLKLAGHADDIGKITKRLEKHLNKAIKKASLTSGQRAALLKNPGLEKAFRGTQIHAAFKKLVESDKWLTKRVDVNIGARDVRGRFISAPDVTIRGGGQWWDVTTESQWNLHLDTYVEWGEGHGLFY